VPYYLPIDQLTELWVIAMVRYELNKCKVPVSEDERAKDPPGLAECRNPKALYKQPFDKALLSQRR
jgi:hypothetical protein